MSHTHTPCLWQGSATEDEVKMKMRGKWRWGDLEDEMKTYLTRTRRGERKRRRREHQHNTPGPERANPGKARKKKSGGSTDTEQDQRRGGRTKAPEPTWHSETYKHLSTRRSQPTWGGKNAWDRGPMGISWWNHKKLKQDSVPNFLNVVRLFPAPGPWSSLAPIGIKRLSSSSELGAQHVSPHQKPKRPHLQEEDMPVACCLACHVSSQSWSCSKNGGFWMFGTAAHERTDHWGPWDCRCSGTLKRLNNRKASCCTLLKWITRLKCVKAFRSVDIHPKQGCLKWPYGTMSESP